MGQQYKSVFGFSWICLLAVAADIVQEGAADLGKGWEKLSTIALESPGSASELEQRQGTVMMHDAMGLLKTRILRIIDRPYHIADEGTRRN